MQHIEKVFDGKKAFRAYRVCDKNKDKNDVKSV
jgi:hypothetical protein